MSNMANIRTWVDALRSDEYEQGVGQLYYNDGPGGRFCCWGVACDLARRAGVPITDVRGALGADQFAPDEVHAWLGITRKIDSGDYRVEHIDADGDLTQTYLAELNDSDYTFHDIADIIEANLLDGETR